MIIHGRSDATLNPGGVRIETAEFYNQVEQLTEVAEAVCIGQNWEDDVRVVLFVRLAEGAMLDALLENAIRQKIRQGATPRHVPAKIIAVPDIPRTKSGKITEIAVRDVVHGKTVKNVDALANPEMLSFFSEINALACWAASQSESGVATVRPKCRGRLRAGDPGAAVLSRPVSTGPDRAFTAKLTTGGFTVQHVTLHPSHTAIRRLIGP